MRVLRSGIIPFTLAALGTATLLAVGSGLSEDSIRAYIRLTAGFSVMLFALAWSASSLHLLQPSGRWQPVLRARRRIGIAFALSHTFHLLGIVALIYVVFEGDWSEIGLAGFGIYTAIYLMAFTSNDWSVRALGPAVWKCLHWLGGYAIWVAFTVSYAGNALQAGSPQHYAFAVLCLSLAALRGAAFVVRRQRAVGEGIQA